MGKSRIRIVINDAEGLKLKRKVDIEDLQLEIKALKKCMIVSLKYIRVNLTTWPLI